MSKTRPADDIVNATDDSQIIFLDLDEPDRRRIAVRRRFGSGAGFHYPAVCWLGGFKSTMQSEKASRLDDWAAENGRAFLRFDYSGHGESGGSFAAGTITRWLGESLAVFRAMTEGPVVLVGSSMGGWIALLMARALGAAEATARLAGMVLIAPATDFTEALIFSRLSPEAREALQSNGVWLRPSPYSEEPYPITRQLIEDGRRHLLLGSTIHSYCPVHILQGMQDGDVPWRHAVALVEHFAADPVTLTLVRDGDHRLSRAEDMTRLVAAVAAIA